jgi:Sigma-70, region 4
LGSAKTRISWRWDSGLDGQEGAIASCASAADGTDEVDARVDASALAPQLGVALAGLAADDRDALLLLALAELSYEEIAAATGAPVGTVRSRLHERHDELDTNLDLVQEHLLVDVEPSMASREAARGRLLEEIQAERRDRRPSQLRRRLRALGARQFALVAGALALGAMGATAGTILALTDLNFSHDTPAALFKATRGGRRPGAERRSSRARSEVESVQVPTAGNGFVFLEYRVATGVVASRSGSSRRRATRSRSVTRSVAQPHR